MTATLFSANDASAPVLATTGGGSLHDILKACLVDGYGTRTPAGGWTVAFVDDVNHKLVLKHPTEEKYLRFDDNLHANYAELRVFDSMSDIDTGAGEFPDPSQMINTPKIGKRYNSEAQCNTWHMLVHDSGDWIYFWTYHLTYPTGFFIGKVPLWDGINTCWMVTGYAATSITSSNFPKCLWQPDAGTSYAWTNVNSWGLPGWQNVECQIPEDIMPYPHPMTGKLYFVKEYIRSAAAPLVQMAKFPNRNVSWGQFGATGGPFQVHNKVTVGSRKFITMVYSSYAYLMEYDTDAG
jgi:hypothetical protein